ncbi:MAG: hypothetical protein NVS2B16_01640 [Chloroflexota bacterium]
MLLVDVDSQVSIGKLELVTPRLCIAALTPGNVVGEIFDMDLPPLGGELVHGHTPFLENQNRLVAVDGQYRLNAEIIRRPRAHKTLAIR